jgi:cytosine/uracil/thiamine/allantoin permease
MFPKKNAFFRKIQKKEVRRMEWVTLIISVIALGLSIWAMKRTGGLNEMKKEVESVSSLGESLRKKTADVLDRVEKKVRRDEKPEETTKEGDR